ncbi:MAG: protein jag [Firmicutes bacterium]|jgi:spoIIIJ-associated protein|nr:protein jag [Bacillota bacterium]
MEAIEATGRTVEEAVQSALARLGLTREHVNVEILDEGSRRLFGLLGAKSARVRVTPREDALQPQEKGPGPDGVVTGTSSPERKPDYGRGGRRRAASPDHPARDERNERGPREGKPAGEQPSTGDQAVGEAVGFLRGLIDVMGLEAVVEARPGDGVTVLDVEGRSLGVMIGRRGETLDAIQYLVNLAAARRARASGDTERGRFIVDVSGYRRKREETLKALATSLAKKALRDGKQEVLEPMSALERRIVHLALQDIEGITTHSEGKEPYRRVVISPK